MMRALILAALVLVCGSASALTPQDETLTPDQELRYRSMIHELRCLVCQNQTIADSSADLAGDLRREVRQHIAAGASDDDVRRYVTDRYGDFVLYKPPLTTRTAVLWIGPFMLVGFGLLVVIRILRRPRAVATPAPSAETARLRQLLDEEER